MGMTLERAIGLASEWANGHVNAIRDGEAEAYHELFLELLLEKKNNGCISVKDRKKQIVCPVRSGSEFIPIEIPTEATPSAATKACPHCGGTGMREANVTNADRIRSMSDGELAWELMTWRCEAVAKYHGVSSEYPNTQRTILGWLQQPAEDDA